MARSSGHPKLEWDAKKLRWRLRFSWKKKRYDFSCSTIPKTAKQQAMNWAEARSSEVKSGKWAEAAVSGTEPNALLEEVARVFLNERSGGVVSSGWATTQKLHLEAHLLPVFRRLSDVNKGTIATYQANRLKSVRWATVTKELSTLRQLCTYAAEKGLIGDVPHFPKKPGKSLGTRHARGRQGHTGELDAHITERLIAALPEMARASRVDGIRWPLRSYYAIMYETSLRPGFWDRFRVGVHWRSGRTDLTITADADKNRWGRVVPLTPTAAAILESTPVQPDGRMFAARDYRDTVRAVAKQLGLPAEVVKRVTAYDMRHQAITRFVAHGGVLGAAYLAGHKQITTTNKYSHANQEHAAKTVASMPNSGGLSGGAPTKRGTGKKGSKR